jgi:hypothetical protein
MEKAFGELHDDDGRVIRTVATRKWGINDPGSANALFCAFSLPEIAAFGGYDLSLG